MEIEAPYVAKKAEPGQFIIFRIDEAGERIPLTIADFNREKGTVTIIFQEVGKTTKDWVSWPKVMRFLILLGHLVLPHILRA
ncbi:MAG: hypothetical protein ACTIDA_05940 [Pseudolactococcus laudensis]